MGRIEDRYDDTAPYTENLEQQDQAEGDHDLHPDFTGNYNLSDDLGIPSVDSTELPEDEYRRVLLTCEAARRARHHARRARHHARRGLKCRTH